MDPIPISETCPSCGSDQFRKVRSKRTIAFTDDRICLKCEARYAPPTPRWAGILFVVFGLIVSLAGAIMVVVFMLSLSRDDGRVDVIGLAFGVGFLLVGPASVIHGIHAISKAGSV